MTALAAAGRVPAMPAVRVFEHHLLVYRRIWRGTLFMTFFSPILFLAAMGFGLGGFVDNAGSGAAAATGGVPYAAFLAPGLLAAVAMQAASFESTYPIMAAILWNRIYHAMLATPMSVRDVVAGQFAWIAFRLLIVAGAFFIVMVAFGLVRSPLAILALPSAMLTGLSVSAPIVAYAATQRNDNGFSAIFRFVITPMFLFSGTFFPIDRLPDFLQPVAYVTPLYHGVALSRGFALGTIDPLGVAVHLGYLVVVTAAGIGLAYVLLRRALVK
jgi:lipooligosaccharide transport system permease protein